MDNEKQNKIKQLRSGQLTNGIRTREYWTPEDDNQLRQLFQMGVGISDTALEMNRTERAIMQRIELLKLFEPCRRASNKTPDKFCPLQNICKKKEVCPRCIFRT